ncbi:HNH endonuclease domain-containing protein [Pedobacter suwonensis]|uniref:HNH endonuclease domain-containing protein n=1 Tax=Pedobacter suwonensis TaxID=332999 RepID=UPI0025FB45D1|nr:HNH endonuclease domain-containing protein [uncultured Pedobacter sp.]
MVIEEVGGVDCIYTNQKLYKAGFAVEHFIPYAFVSHDLLWNLSPASPVFNSAKSDKLPRMAKYFDAFQDTKVKHMITFLHTILAHLPSSTFKKNA